MKKQVMKGGKMYHFIKFSNGAYLCTDHATTDDWVNLAEQEAKIIYVEERYREPEDNVKIESKLKHY